jgi:midasin
VSKLAERKKWAHLTAAFRAALAKVDIDVAAAGAEEQQPEANGTAAATGTAAGAAAGEQPSKKRRSSSGSAVVVLAPSLKAAWHQFAGDLAVAERTAAVAEGGFAFAFVEGQLVKAVREGHWLLLDEINLAPPEVGGCGHTCLLAC